MLLVLELLRLTTTVCGLPLGWFLVMVLSGFDFGFCGLCVLSLCLLVRLLVSFLLLGFVDLVWLFPVVFEFYGLVCFAFDILFCLFSCLLRILVFVSIVCGLVLFACCTFVVLFVCTFQVDLLDCGETAGCFDLSWV